jgi:hypothetical protein
MTMSAQDLFESLPPAQQAAVFDLFAPSLADGWIPADTDVEAAIQRVLRAGLDQSDAGA